MTNIKVIDEDCARFIEQFSTVHDYRYDRDLPRRVVDIRESFGI